jgi:hypothetical protein
VRYAAQALSHARQARKTDSTSSQLSKYPAIVNLEKQVGVPKVYGVIGAVSLYLFFIILNLGGQLLTNLAGFVIPGYYSLQALFTANKTDDTQWLTVCPSPQLLSLCWCANYNRSTGLSLPSSRMCLVPHPTPSFLVQIWSSTASAHQGIDGYLTRLANQRR